MEDPRPFFKNMLKSTFKTKVGNPEEISSPVVSAIEENTRAIKDKEVAKQISKPIVTALVDVMEKIEKRKDADESEMNSLLERVKMLKGDQGESADEDFIISAVVPQVLEKVGEVIKPLIPEPIPGKNGDDYILTEKDKKEIAKSIKVPIIEKVIEHTVETVIEKTPIVTNEIKEVAVADKAEVLKEKLESLEGDDRLDAKAIKNLPKASFGGGGGIKRIDGALDTRIISPTNGQTLVWNSTRQVWENSAGGSGSGHVIQDEGTPLTARANLNFVGANVNVTDDAGNDATVVTISGGSGSPGGSDTQVQFNDGGSFGGDAGLTYNKTTDTLTVGQIIDSGLTASRLMVTDVSKQLTSSAVTATEAGYLSGVTSALQTQLDGKVNDTGDTMTGNLAITIPNSGNALAATITQNDTTNNPRAVSITNAGTNNSLFIDANGNTGSSASTSGALLLNNTDNLGIGANFYTNAGAGQSVSLVFMKQDNALADRPVLRIDNDGTLNAITINNNLATSSTAAVGIANAGLSNNLFLTKSNTSNTNPVIDITNNAASSVGIQITHTDAANSQGLIKLISPSPEIEFVESDKTTPEGKFEIRGQDNQFTVNSRNSADSGFENIITINQLKNGGLTKFFGSIETAGNIELGHVSDTTVSRSAAGVIAVEGVVIPSISSTSTLTNKRVSPRTGTTTSSATPTINTDNVDFYSLTAQSADITSFTSNLSGTPTEGQKLWIAITGTAARAITWGSSFEASTVALPTTTVSTNRLDVGFVWNTVTSKWRCVATC